MNVYVLQEELDDGAEGTVLGVFDTPESAMHAAPGANWTWKLLPPTKLTAREWYGHRPRGSPGDVYLVEWKVRP